MLLKTLICWWQNRRSWRNTNERKWLVPTRNLEMAKQSQRIRQNKKQLVHLRNYAASNGKKHNASHVANTAVFLFKTLVIYERCTNATKKM